MVHTRLDARDSRVHAQRVDIERILLNLVFNAAAAMPSGGVLDDRDRVERRHPQGLARFHSVLRDAAAQGPRHRTRHDRTPSSSGPLIRWRARETDGSGLGLACIALIVTRLAGTLAIDCAEPPGTVVTVTLPLSSNGMGRIH